MKRFAYVRVEDAGTALSWAAKGGRFKAGGLDLLDRMKRGTLAPELLIDLAGWKEARGIRTTEEGWSLGSLTTLADLAESGHGLPAGIREAAENTATPQVRNRATLGGNLCQTPRCWYFHDAEISCAKKGGAGCPAREGRNEGHAVLSYGECPAVQGGNLAPILCALGAWALGREADGASRRMPLADFCKALETDWDRAPLLLERIEVPKTFPGTSHVEVRHRDSFDWAVASAAVAMRLEGGRIAEVRAWLGGVAPGPWRAASVEKDLAGLDPKPGTFRKAAEAALREARPLSEGAYKVAMARHVLEKALERAAARAAEEGR